VNDQDPYPKRLRDIGEFGFIKHVRERFGGPARPGETGIGDDAAVLASPGGKLVLSTDMLVEGTHFDMKYVRPVEAGFRALSANLSDLAAMGAKPVCYLAGVAAPPQTPVSVLSGVFAGMARAARPSGIRLMGGDTSRADGIILSLTVVGHIPRGNPILRRGARPADILFVTGEPGWSFLGLLLLSRGRPERPSHWQREAMRRHLKPVARWKEGMLAAASGAVSAMIDVSDGIVPDLSHILDPSGAGALLDEKAFRRSPRFLAAAKALGVDPTRAFLGGGEDYELLMAVRPHRCEAFRRAARAFPAGAFPIGVVTAEKGIRVRRTDGSWMAGTELPRGFVHFEKGC
jgi:thiamine-monophosphate kinase